MGGRPGRTYVRGDRRLAISCRSGSAAEPRNGVAFLVDSFKQVGDVGNAVPIHNRGNRNILRAIALPVESAERAACPLSGTGARPPSDR